MLSLFFSLSLSCLFLSSDDSGIIGSVISENYTFFHEYFNDPSETSEFPDKARLIATKEAEFGTCFVSVLVTGAIVSVFAGGCFFGALIAGYTANKIGRKR